MKKDSGWKSAASAYGNDPLIPRPSGKVAKDPPPSAAEIYGGNKQVGKGGGKKGGKRGY